MNNQLKIVLEKIARKVNGRGITWGVGASVMLTHYGIVKNPRDIDILVELKDIEKLDKILSGMGEKKRGLPDKVYKTKCFYEYTIDGIEIDVMGGLCITYEEKDYLFNFTEESIGDYMEIGSVRIPVCRVSEWYEIYKLIPKREERVGAIEEYLRGNDK